MSRWLSVRATLLVLAVAAVVVAQGPGVDAAEGGQTSQGSDTGAGTVTATASQDLVGGRAASGASASRPRCSWEVFVDLQQATNPDAGEVPPIRREADGSIPLAGSPPTKTTSTLYKRVCDGQRGSRRDFVDVNDLAWVPDFVELRWEDVVNALRRCRDGEGASARSRSVTAQVPEPAMDMNPDPSVGSPQNDLPPRSVVNIGLWLAVADPGQVSITASVGPVWATVTARYQTTTWNLGNGDSVVCEGLGTPIVDKSTEDQGPCGYTYRWPSAPKFTGTDDLAYHASVNGHWAITYATSTGAAGTLPAVDRTTAFLYQVREIQTVRVGENG